jgi:hypothetical protein
MEDLSAVSAQPRLRLLPDHFSQIKDARQSWKVAYPLREVFFLVVCATITCPPLRPEDWGAHRVRRHSLPCDDERTIRWLTALMALCCDPLAIAVTAAVSTRR